MTVDRCPRCALRSCLCAEVPIVTPATGVMVIRHSLERHRNSNSVRWAALAIPRLELVEHGGRDDTLDVAPVQRPGVWLVYPGPGGPAPPVGEKPEALLFLDGSWAQTRRMLQRLPGLTGLPRLTLPAAPSRRRLRQPPDGGLATLEAIAAALRHLGDADAAARLDALYALAVERSGSEFSLVARHPSC